MNELDLYKEAQKKVISIVLNGDQEIFDRVRNNLKIQFFTDIRYKFILEAVEWIYDNGHSLTVLTVINCLSLKTDSKEKSYLSYIDPENHNPEHYLDELKAYAEPEDMLSVDSYIKMIADKYAVAMSTEMANKIVRLATLNQLTAGKVRNIIEEYGSYLYDEMEKNKPRTLQQVAVSLEKKIESSDKYSNSIIRTGIPIIDNAIWMTPTNTTVIGADTSHGKTSLALQIGWNVAKQKKPLTDPLTNDSILDENGNRKYGNRVVLIFSLEMNEDELFTKLLCNAINSSYADFELNTTKEERIKHVQWFREKVKQLAPNLIIDYTSHSKDEILSKCKMVKMIYGSIDLVIIDYIQLIEEVKNASSGAREDSVYRQISRFVKKNIAGRLETHAIALSQLRNPDTDKSGNPIHKPTMFRLFGSSAFRQDASNIIMVFREWTTGQKMTTLEMKSGEQTSVSTYMLSRLIFAKVRMGENAIEKIVGFYPYSTYFISLKTLMNAGVDLSKPDHNFRYDVASDFLSEPEIEN